jgi:hypothetical protein
LTSFQLNFISPILDSQHPIKSPKFLPSHDKNQPFCSQLQSDLPIQTNNLDPETNNVPQTFHFLSPTQHDEKSENQNISPQEHTFIPTSLTPEFIPNPQELPSHIQSTILQSKMIFITETLIEAGNAFEQKEIPPYKIESPSLPNIFGLLSPSQSRLKTSPRMKNKIIPPI